MSKIREKAILTEHFSKAKELLKNKKPNEARDQIDHAIVHTVKLKEGGFIPENRIVEGEHIDLWSTRLWVFLEKHGLLLN